MIQIPFFIIFGIYSYFIFFLIYGIFRLKKFETIDINPVTRFTLIIPFRNEDKNLSTLLKSISKLNYPKDLFEIILINDFSTDKSEEIINRWRFQNGLIETTLLENLRLSNSPKKDAITRAIPIVKNDWIVTTDADCKLNKNWLLTLDNFIQKENPDMIVGAVVYRTKNNWFHHFQQLDLLSLQGTTIGSFGIKKPFMCNGANFAYTKKLFQKIDGFTGNNNKASGDDVFLLQKALLNDEFKVMYLKNKAAIVKTKPENDLYKLFMQRVRWASKTTSYTSIYAKKLAIVVLTMNFSLIIGLILSMTNLLNWTTLLQVFILKYIVDYFLLYKTNQFLIQNKKIIPIASSILYPFFSSIVGIYSLFGSFTWKNRTFLR